MRVLFNEKAKTSWRDPFPPILPILEGCFLLWHNFNNILLSPCGILPSELYLLEFYLKQSHQDPEWVEYVHQVLKTTPIHSATYEVMVRDFLNTEFCFVTRDQICSLYQLIFYGREDPQFWIDPIDLDSILRVPFETNPYSLFPIRSETKRYISLSESISL